ncbi:MAG TPA: hypothetical protein VGQ86_04525 [Candidatus Limnocylindria bacterium]|jgi:hypothetical protein|nr:hypothetical protein [Candidatus Limnocylindria bacterium]
MRRAPLLALALLAVVAMPVAADDDRSHFRRTTPRAVLQNDGGTLVLGVPAGRAWGIESELRPIPAEAALAVRLVVDHGDVREAFVRVAYYARATGRPRQIAVADSETVPSGDGRLLLVPLDPPAGAVAYRVRVLARLRADAPRSRDDAVRARVSVIDRDATRWGSLFSRLLPDGP